MGVPTPEGFICFISHRMYNCLPLFYFISSAYLRVEFVGWVMIPFEFLSYLLFLGAQKCWMGESQKGEEEREAKTPGYILNRIEFAVQLCDLIIQLYVNCW